MPTISALRREDAGDRLAPGLLAWLVDGLVAGGPQLLGGGRDRLRRGDLELDRDLWDGSALRPRVGAVARLRRL